MPADLSDDFVRNWYEYWRLDSGDRAERKALEMGEPQAVCTAHAWVAERLDEGGEGAVELLIRLAEGARTDDELAVLGAGPVEDLLSEHGEEIEPRLAAAARQSPALARALTYAHAP